MTFGVGGREDGGGASLPESMGLLSESMGPLWGASRWLESAKEFPGERGF